MGVLAGVDESLAGGRVDHHHPGDAQGDQRPEQAVVDAVAATEVRRQGAQRVGHWRTSSRARPVQGYAPPPAHLQGRLVGQHRQTVERATPRVGVARAPLDLARLVDDVDGDRRRGARPGAPPLRCPRPSLGNRVDDQIHGPIDQRRRVHVRVPRRPVRRPCAACDRARRPTARRASTRASTIALAAPPAPSTTAWALSTTSPYAASSASMKPSPSVLAPWSTPSRTNSELTERGATGHSLASSHISNAAPFRGLVIERASKRRAEQVRNVSPRGQGQAPRASTCPSAREAQADLVQLRRERVCDGRARDADAPVHPRPRDAASGSACSCSAKVVEN